MKKNPFYGAVNLTCERKKKIHAVLKFQLAVNFSFGGCKHPLRYKVKGRSDNTVKERCKALKNSDISTRWSILSNQYKIFSRQARTNKCAAQYRVGCIL